MTAGRTLIQDFSTANRLYVNAEITFWTVLNGEKTAEKATLYDSYTGAGLLANPQKLDSFGKLRQPVYVDEAVIATVSGLGNVPAHDTGVIGYVPIFQGTGTPEGAITASRGAIFLRTDGGTGTTFYVKETGDATNTGWVAK